MSSIKLPLMNLRPYQQVVWDKWFTNRQRLIDAHKEFSRLRSWCEAKGEIEVLPGLSGIKVLKKTDEVKKLKKVIDFLKPGKFQWVEKGGTEKKRRKS